MEDSRIRYKEFLPLALKPLDLYSIQKKTAVYIAILHDYLKSKGLDSRLISQVGNFVIHELLF